MHPVELLPTVIMGLAIQWGLDLRMQANNARGIPNNEPEKYNTPAILIPILLALVGTSLNLLKNGFDPVGETAIAFALGMAFYTSGKWTLEAWQENQTNKNKEC